MLGHWTTDTDSEWPSGAFRIQLYTRIRKVYENMKKLKISHQEHDHQQSPNINDGDSDGNTEYEDDDGDVDHDDMPASDTTWTMYC